jgi:hypothetical protein
MTEINWSMMPQGIPANSCSAFWQSSAFLTGSIWLPVAVSSSVAVQTSNAALLDKPPPSGTVEAITTSNAGIFVPDC